VSGQDPKIVARTYDAVAREYAERFSDEHEHKPMDQEVLRRFAQAVGQRRPVWDFGCGPGQTAAYLRELGLEAAGLDLSERTLQQARAAHPSLHFRQGNLLELDFGDDSIAGVVAFYAVVHFSPEQLRRACREVFRVLQPGGLLLLTYHIGVETLHIEEFLGQVIDIDFMFFTSAFISECLEGCGFGAVETIERDPYPEVEYQSRRGYVFATKP
jgi:SAM-dependent methyltransferase